MTTKIIIGFAALIVGIMIGIRVEVNTHKHECKCPKDLSSALKGCDLVVSELHNQLVGCEYSLSETEEARAKCSEFLKDNVGRRP
jgi:hypothetical protein